MGWQDDFQSDGQRKIAAALLPSQPVADVHPSGLPRQYVEGIRKHEGFDRKAFWDYKQWTNGFGTRAKHPGEVIDRTTAEQRYADELGKARQSVEKFAPNLPDGPKAALTSLTYNSGEKWMKSGLGAAVKSGDLDAAKNRFVQYSKAGGKPLPALVQRRNDEAKWFAGTTVTPEPQSTFQPPQTVNNEGVVATASMMKSPPPATPGTAFTNVAMNGGVISTAPMPLVDIPGAPQTAPMPVVKPSSSFASNMPIYGQGQSAPIQNERTGTTMRPTPGREVLSMGGLSPEQRRDTLQGAYDRGKKDMLYVHDANPRVVARPGEASWTPGKEKLTTGPAFANSFLASNADYGAKPLPMDSGNALKGSRWDDGTHTGVYPSGGMPDGATQANMLTSPPALPTVAPLPAPQGEPKPVQPIEAKDRPAQIAQATQTAPPAPPEPASPEPPKTMLNSSPQSAPSRMALGAGDVTPPAAQQTPPAPSQAEKSAQPKPSGGILSAPPKPKTPEWGWNNGQMGVTWKNGSFTGFGG